MHEARTLDFHLSWPLIAVALLLAACQPAPAAPTAAPKPPAVASPGPAKPAAASPAPAKVAGPADWEAQWNALVEAAKKEGKVVLHGPPVAELRTALPARFKERFGIAVEHIGGSASELGARVESERSAGLYTVDVSLGGATTFVTKYHPNRWIEALRPVLIHPEVTSPDRWKRGKLWFSDPEDQYVLRLINATNSLGGVNTDKVNWNDLSTARGLLNPRFKGLISGEDPTRPGGGNALAVYLYVQLGEDFIRDLYFGQEVRLSSDRRTLSDGLARGVTPINLGMSNADAAYAQLVKEGFPIKVLAGRFSDAPGYVTAGSGLMLLMANAPHPNAAKVLVNWLASKEGLDILSRADQKPSLRTDLDESWLAEYAVPKAGVEYYDSADWDTVKGEKARVDARIRAIFGQ